MTLYKQILFQIKKRIPYKIKRFYFRVKHRGNKHYCNVCNSNIKRFLPGGLDLKILNELDIVGGGYHEYDYCPICKASYRQRLVKLYFDNNHIFNLPLRILQVAPEESLYHLLKGNRGEKFICGDIMPERYSYYAKPEFLDLTQLKYQNNSFDLVICNHVLEHIPNDHKAMSEIFRVLDQNGIAILQVPISLKLKKTFEDTSIVSEQERLAKFGQRDHVRVYALDYTDKLRDVGFDVEIYQPQSSDTSYDFHKLMLDPKEVVFAAHKRNK